MSILDTYHYTLPAELVASHPVEPRDRARLLVYDTKHDHISVATFRELPAYLPPASLLVFNNTKVVPARLSVSADRGDVLELLLLIDEGIQEGGFVHGLVSRFVAIGEVLSVGGVNFVVRDNREKWMKLETRASYEALLRLLEAYGTTPIPPYIKGILPEEAVLRSEYQSVFATRAASVAAPTASLHFTHELLAALKSAHHTTTEVTLHVGLGTFAPVGPENLEQKRLHLERYQVNQVTSSVIKSARDTSKPIVAVGTTVVRTLESARERLLKGEPASGATDLFIMPPYQFTIPDALVTNFHVPRSSLMCMVDAFLQHKRSSRSLLWLYEYAIAEKFRFYSFGDGMLIL